MRDLLRGNGRSGDDLLKLGVVDEIIKEPIGGAHYNIEEMANNLKESLVKSLKEFENMDSEQLRSQRYSKFRGMGVFIQK